METGVPHFAEAPRQRSPVGFADRLQGQPGARPRLLGPLLRAPCRPLHPAIQEQLRVQQVRSSRQPRTGDSFAGSPSPPDNATVSSGTGRFGPGTTAASVGRIGSVQMGCTTAGRSGPGAFAAGAPSLEAASDCSVEPACPLAVLCSDECLPDAVAATTDGDTASPCQAACFPPSSVLAPAAVSRSGRGTTPDGMARLSRSTASDVETRPASNCRELRIAVSRALGARLQFPPRVVTCLRL